MIRKINNKKEERNCKVTVRFTPSEYELISRNSNKAEMTISEYIRAQLRKGKVTVTKKVVSNNDDIKKLAEEYHKIGINLNQIAHHLNSGSDVTAALLIDIEKRISDLQELRKDL